MLILCFKYSFSFCRRCDRSHSLPLLLESSRILDALCLHSLQMFAPITRETCRGAELHRRDYYALNITLNGELLNSYLYICMKLRYSNMCRHGERDSHAPPNRRELSSFSGTLCLCISCQIWESKRDVTNRFDVRLIRLPLPPLLRTCRACAGVRVPPAHLWRRPDSQDAASARPISHAR